MNNTDINTPRTIDNSTGNVVPTHSKKIDLASINDVRLELATVYRLMRNGQIETGEGTKLAYVLNTISKMIVDHELETRLTLLENKK